MSALYVPYLAAALLLVVAGVPKVLDPEPTRAVARAAGLPLESAVVRLFGLTEVALGAAAVAVGVRMVPLLVGLLYAGFTVVVTRGLVRGDMETCGCFSGDDSPPSLLHVVVNVGLATSAVWVAVVGPAPASVLQLLADPTRAGVAVVVLALAVAALVHFVIVMLPRIQGPVLPRLGEVS